MLPCAEQEREQERGIRCRCNSATGSGWRDGPPEEEGQTKYDLVLYHKAALKPKRLGTNRKYELKLDMKRIRFMMCLYI